MKACAKILAPLALAATVMPPLLFMLKAVNEDVMKATMLVATVGWFVAAPFWLKGGEE